MGLDCTHGAWHGSYMAFMRWRREIARLCGIPLQFMEGFYGEDMERTLNLLERAETGGKPKVVGDNGRSNAWITDSLRDDLNVFPLKWETLKRDPIHALLNHSDCEGYLTPSECRKIADRLEELLPLLPKEPDNGHIGDWRVKTQKFIDGCRAAAAAKERLQFH